MRIEQIVNTTINNILNDNTPLNQKKNDLFVLHQKIMQTENQNVNHLLQEVFKAVRMVDAEKYERQRQEEMRKQQELIEMEERMRNFNFVHHVCSQEDFPEFYEKQEEVIDDIEEIDEEMEDLTNQIQNLTIDLKKYKVVELKKIAKNNGLKGYSKLKKNDLIDLLNNLENLKL